MSDLILHLVLMIVLVIVIVLAIEVFRPRHPSENHLIEQDHE